MTTELVEFAFSGEIDMPRVSLWPDGDDPPVVTLADVLAAIRADRIRRVEDMLAKWSLDCVLSLTITVQRPNPLAGQLTFDGGVEPDTLTERGTYREFPT